MSCASVGLCLSLAALSGCGGSTVDIGGPVVVPGPLRAEGSSDSRKRFLRQEADQESTQPGPVAATRPFGGFRYDLPPGWSEVAAIEFRDVNLRTSQGIEAWVTRIGRKLDRTEQESNLRRWERQCGVARNSLSFDSLPQRPWLGGTAYTVDLQEAGGGSTEPNRSLIRAAFLDDGAVFARMKGPVSLVAQELASFDLFCDSLGTLEGVKGVTWTAPPGFEVAKTGGFVDAAYSFGKMRATVSVGIGADLKTNLDRWFGQVGVDLPENLETLPRRTLDGEDFVLVDIAGNGQALLGACSTTPDLGIYFKMSGSDEDREAARTAFLAWLGSVDLEGN